ncbi:MAG: c-type cytochrome [Pseudomonadota bacterium]|nr:c-type cytochrome [Pseudomonadota bacterium]
MTKRKHLRIMLLLRHAVLVLVLLGAGGLVFLAAGMAPIAADAGHWAVTRVLLHSAMSRAVEVRAMPLAAPPLDDPALLQKGAGHYATACMDCHGAPGVPRRHAVRQMVPTPPFLAEKLGRMTPEELFWVVNHGIKYTAMPAWGTRGRDDEVWAMVAFLEQIQDMSPERYRALAYGPDGDDHSVLGDCARCHGRDGAGRGTDAFPKLAGLDEAYLLASLEAFASGERRSGIMQPVAADLASADLRAMAEHYAKQQPRPSPPTHVSAATAESIARGRELAQAGDGLRRIPACAACHGPGAGQRNRMYPALAGQHAGYIDLQLQLFRKGGRGGTEFAPIMVRAAAGLTDRDIADVAAYYASLPATPAGAGGPATGM